MKARWIVAATLASGCQWDIVVGQVRATVSADATAVDAITDAPTRDAADVTDATDVTDAVDVTDATDVTDAADVTDATDVTDAVDVTDATDAREDVVVEEPMGTLAAVSLGAAFTCALRSDGSAWCWGANERGQLGDGTTTDRATPRRVGGITAATALAAGGHHACVRLRDGSAWCWAPTSADSSATGPPPIGGAPPARSRPRSKRSRRAARIRAFARALR